MAGNFYQFDPQSAAEKAVSVIGFGYDLSKDIRLSTCRPGPSGSRLIELDSTVCRDLLFPGGVVVRNVPNSIKCDKGERTRFTSDVLSFNQMSEKFNQDLSLSGKIPSGLFNAMFDFKGCWQKDATATKSLGFDGWFITLYNVELERAHITLSDRVKQEVPTTWDPAAIAEFIEKYGTHVIVGVKMGGKDVIHIKQLQNSSLQPNEVQKTLKQLADERFSENERTPEFSKKPKEEPYMPWDLQGMLAGSIRPPVVTRSKNNDIVNVYIRRGGVDFSQGHSQWLSTISQSPNVISMSFVPITSLLSGVRGNGFLSHAVNLYLRYKPPIEELHVFLEFQLPRQWAPVYGDLPLCLKRRKQASPSLQFTFMGPKLYVNTMRVDTENRPVTGIRLYLEGKKSDQKILKLIKDEEVEENDGISIANSKKEPLVQLIEDFHKHYQSLYAQYDHLTGELRKKVHGKREKDASSSSSSDSDSDYSSKDGGSKNGQLESEFQNIANSIKQEPEAANLEIADLMRKLAATSEEKEALNSDYLASLSKVQEAEEIIKELRLESERSGSEKSNLLAENVELRHKLDTAAKVEAEVNQRLEDLKTENNNLILEKETDVKRIEDDGKFIEELSREVDQLKEENITVKHELESVKGEVSYMQQQLESAEHQVSELSHSLNATVEENKSLNSKLSEVSNEIQQAQGKIQKLMTEMSQSKEDLGEKEMELLSLKELHDVYGNQSSAHIRELEAHVTSLELELESLRATNRDIVVQIENKASEAKQLGEQNIGLQSLISELEKMSKKREEELSTLRKKLEDNEKESLSRVENLTVQINNLLLDMESLQTENAQLEERIVFKSDEASTQVKSLMDQVNTLQQELESLHSKKAELELQLERKTQAISDYVIEIEKVKEEIVSKIEDQQRVQQEKEGFLAQTKELEFEVNSLKNQKGELEEELKTTIEGNGQLREEKVGLQGQIFGLEKSLEERGLEFTALLEKHASRENETSSQLTALVEQVNNLQQELDSLQIRRNELELHLEREKQESSERLTELENQKSELESQINNQQRMLEEQGEAHKKLTEEYKQVEGFYRQCEANLEVTERKMQEMSEVLHKTTESKNQMAADLKQMVEDLQRDLEAKGEEKNDFVNQIADHQRMLKEQEDAFNKLSEEYKQLETSLEDCKAIIEVTERKMQEMVGEHSKNVQSKDQIVADLEQTIEDLKQDLEMKRDELNTSVENICTIEVKLRLSNQKLRVTEQLLTEKEESFRKAEAKFLEEQRMLEERITTLSGILAANNEAHCRMITDISENVNTTLTGFDAVIWKFEEGYSKYKHCIEETSKELRIAKNWVEETKNEKKQLANEINNLIEQLKGHIEQESMLRDRVEKLRIKANKEEGEKENLLKAVKQLENKVGFLEKAMKEKDQGILGLGEEKREAIRQLCLWIDYHRSRCDDLKEIISKTVRVQRAT